MDDDRIGTEGAVDPGLLDALRHIAADPQNRVLAVMDGALAAGLSVRLSEAGLWHRSLLREGATADLVATGPWLVDPSRRLRAAKQVEEDAPPDLGDETLAAQARALEAEAKTAFEAGDDTPFRKPLDDWQDIDAAPALETILRTAEPNGGVVFWTGGRTLTAEVLHAHLRGLGQVMLPASAIGEPELAQFRHADPDVLAQLVPFLDTAQLSRLLGPAEAVVFLPGPDWRGDPMRSPLKRIRRPAGASDAARGVLEISPVQYRLISEARLQASRRRVARYLRDVDPIHTDTDEATLLGVVLEAEASGRTLGLQSERAHMKWAYLMSVTGGGVKNHPEVERHFRRHPRHPDDAVDDLLADLETASVGKWNAIFSGRR